MLIAPDWINKDKYIHLIQNDVNTTKDTEFYMFMNINDTKLSLNLAKKK